jgi:hypothetical protein
MENIWGFDDPVHLAQGYTQRNQDDSSLFPEQMGKWLCFLLISIASFKMACIKGSL